MVSTQSWPRPWRRLPAPDPRLPAAAPTPAPAPALKNNAKLTCSRVPGNMFACAWQYLFSGVWSNAFGLLTFLPVLGNMFSGCWITCFRVPGAKNGAWRLLSDHGHSLNRPDVAILAPNVPILALNFLSPDRVRPNSVHA